jgi:aminopeptidase N
MKNYFINTVIIGFLTSMLIYTPVSYGQDRVKSGGSYYCSIKKSNNPLHLIDEKSANSPVHSYDVLNYSIYVDIYNCYLSAQQFPNSFNGYVTITFRADSVLSYIYLHASNNSIVVDSVGMAGVSFTQTNDILDISLDQVYNPGQVASVIVYYHHLDVYDGAFFASSGFVFTDAEPEGARRWFPCWDRPSDKATLDLMARVPVNVRLGSNGRLQDSTIVGNAIIYHWISIHPIATYLITITSRINYQLDIVYWENPQNPGQFTPFRFYYNPGEDPSYIESIISDMTTYYSSLFCDHPFEKNGFASLNQEFTWGGMENQTLTSICPDCWYTSLIAHEFAHQWFGDMITCGTWADLWLNEGFATYIEALWDEHNGGYQAYKDNIDANAQYYLNNNPGWPISNPDWAINTPSPNIMFNYAITYAKGACVMHMFRYVLGDSLFFTALKSYAGDTADFKYKNVVTQDFISKINSVTGQDMGWFINEWIYYPNHPVFNNEYCFVHELTGEWKVYFNAKQIQSGNFFKMPLEIKVYFTDLTDTTLKVMNDYNNQMFVFSFIKEPYLVEFDPSNNIVLKEDTLLVGISPVDHQVNNITLLPAVPNPARNFIIVSYILSQKSPVCLSISDLSGRELDRMNVQAEYKGRHDINYDCSALKSGVYLCRIIAGNFTQTRKVVIIK